jgi:TonB family protein
MRPVPTHTAVVGVLLLATSTMAGCGTGSGASTRPAHVTSADRRALPGLAGRSCRFASGYDDLPSFRELADPRTRGNLALWGSSMEASDSVTLSVRYDETGRLAWVRAIQASLAPDRVGPLERLLLETLNERGPGDWGIRVRVVGGDIAGIEPSIICPAEPRTGMYDRNVVPISALREYQWLPRVRGRYYRMRITIDEDGRPIEVRMERSTGERMLDHYLMEWIHQIDFHPKLHDGIRLASTFTRTVYVPRHGQ